MMPSTDTSRVGSTAIRRPSTTALFFIESLPEISGSRYARHASCSPRAARTSWASRNSPSGLSGPATGSGQQKLSSAAMRSGSPPQAT